MKRSPSRILNEKPGVFGLSVFDFAVLGYLLIGLHTLLGMIGLELLSFPICAAAALGLLSIRLRMREKTIRDYVTYTFSKQIGVKRK